MPAVFEKIRPVLPLVTVITVGLLLRVYGIDWDQEHYLHPDERLYVNAQTIHFPQTITEFFSANSPLNPHMFYYGEFPLFIYKTITSVFGGDFLLNARLFSALLSTVTIPILYLLGKELFSKKVGLLSSIVFTFAAGGIQHAHFITTETILIFILSLLTYLCVLLVKSKRFFLFLPCGILIGLAFASKVTGVTFTLIPLLSFLGLMIKRKHVQTLFLWGVISTVCAIIFGLIFAPYQLIDYKTFSDQQTYMQGVILGTNKPPFVIIYEGTIPYLYQLIQVLPFTFGFLSLPLALIAFVMLSKNVLQHVKKNYVLLLILLFPFIYFVWSGVWYSKFSRYYILLIPFLSLYTGYLLNRFKTYLLIPIVILIIFNGVLFIRIYDAPNTRIAASEWIDTHIPNGSTIAGEHWDDNLPLPLPNVTATYKMVQLTVYDPDTISKISTLSNTLASSDYVILSSRRVYASILQNPKLYPYTTSFYKHLFDGSLGIQKVKTFSNYPYFFSDDLADESFQSYDHPPVLIFKNSHQLQPNEIAQRILHTSYAQ